MSHTIYRLAVHDEDQQDVYFEEGKEEKLLDKNIATTLTAYFDLNKTDEEARQYLYHEISIYYTFNKKLKCGLIDKKTPKPILSRMYLVNPNDRERYFIRLLLLHMRGAT